MSENCIYFLGFFVSCLLLPFAWQDMNKEPTSYHSGATPETPTWEPELEAQNTLPPTNY